MSKENKTKEQITADIKHVEKVKRHIINAKLLFPIMKDLKSIYDAQTALAAVKGYIAAELARKEAEFKVKDLGIDLSKEEDTDITGVMKQILIQLEPENAQEIVELLESYTNTLTKYAEEQFLKNPFSTLKMEDIIKD